MLRSVDWRPLFNTWLLGSPKAIHTRNRVTWKASRKHSAINDLVLDAIYDIVAPGLYWLHRFRKELHKRMNTRLATESEKRNSFHISSQMLILSWTQSVKTKIGDPKKSVTIHIIVS